MADWKLSKRTNACTACDGTFEDGDAYFSLLLMDEAGFGRADRCQTCFSSRSEEEALKTPIWWRTRFFEERKKSLAVDFEAVEGLFLALDGQDDERLSELRYLLSLLLMRKRRLKLVKVRRRGESEAMVVRRPRRQEAFEVEVFDLTPERMDALRLELERIVEGAGAEDILAGPPTVQEPASTDEPASTEDASGETEASDEDARREPSSESREAERNESEDAQESAETPADVASQG